MDSAALAFFGNPVLALFLGLVGAYVLARRSIGNERTDEALDKGFNTTGQILLITGVGGSLGAVIGETGLDKILGDLFSAESGTPVLLTLLLAWFVAAVLHLAIGSISVAAITAAGIIGPILGISTSSRPSSGLPSAPARCSPCRSTATSSGCSRRCSGCRPEGRSRRSRS